MNRLGFKVCLLLLLWAIASFANAQKPGKLTLKQVLALVAAAPDQVAANEIQHRGMTDPPSRNDIARVEQAGGGARTLEALRRLVVTPILVVHSNQDQSEVLLDGAARGTTGPAQALVIRDAEPGPHNITVRKLRYSTAELPVTLVAGQKSEVTGTLAVAVASLSVATNAPNARVEIEGVDLGGRSPENLELPPGSYAVHVSAPRFSSATTEVTLKAGESRRLEIALVVDPSFTRSQIAHAQQELAAGHYAIAFKLAANTLAIEPANGQALSVEAMSAFYGGQYQVFAQLGMRAIQSGGELDIPFLHRHALRTAHLALLKLRSDAIAYQPGERAGEACNIPAFQTPITDLKAVELKQDMHGQRYLELKLAGPGLAKPQNFTFADYRSRMEAQGNGMQFLIAPISGADEITSAASLLQSMLRSMHP